MPEDTKELTIKKLLKENKYIIPIYQRNYDWGEKEVIELLKDIADYAEKNKEKNYYIGTLIVYLRNKNGNEFFEVIDGQQRLTTLNILAAVLKKRYEVKDEVKIDWSKISCNISYDLRSEADEILNGLYKNEDIDISRYSEHEAVFSIAKVYRLIDQQLENIVNNNDNMPSFVNYLFNNVKIVRVLLPEDTELNHYFEIMNSRGEQLEMHEIVKARLMGCLKSSSNDRNDEEKIIFNKIWEACSDMDKFVNANMPSEFRSLVFENWTELNQSLTFVKLLGKYKQNKIEENKKNEKTKNKDENYDEKSLFELANENNQIYGNPYDKNKQNTVDKDRFSSVINFPNFLLQVLKVMFSEDEKYKDTQKFDKIVLDDKRLIVVFDYILSSFKDEKDKAEFAKDFIMTLLRMKYKFDRFVIKREFNNNNDDWSLKRPFRGKEEDSPLDYRHTFYIKSDSKEGDKYDEDAKGDEKDIIMLEAMFHVSDPTQTYKYWLSSILRFLYNKEYSEVKAEELKEHLYNLACNFMKYRYLSSSKKSLEEIVYCENSLENNYVIKKKLLTKGCKIEHFIFNFYDYILWKEDNPKDFEFTYRDSVEHFYPQNPTNGDKMEDKEVLHSFGNLCLISSSMNSKFSNSMPLAKIADYGNNKTFNKSLKLKEMMEICEKEGWHTKQIEDHRDAAIGKIEEYLKIKFTE